MSTERRGAEFFVGLFLLIGLGMIAGMVIIFNKGAQGVTNPYTITVEFPNASGLIKNCDVLISGARVGTVAEAPRLINNQYDVSVPLMINGVVKIPRTATFQIRTNGMLGDAYVDIVPPARYTPADYAQPNETITGMRVAGFDELTAKGSQLMDKLNAEVLTKLSASLDEFKVAATTLNDKLLSDTNMKNVEATFAEFAKTAKDLETVMTKVEVVLDAAATTMKTADSSAGELKLAIGDMRKMADTATKTVDSAKILINKAAAGDGTVGALLSDKQMAADLRSLVSNLRRSGVLFYKDRAPAATPAPEVIVPPKKKR